MLLYYEPLSDSRLKYFELFEFFLVSRKPLLVRCCVVGLGIVQCLANLLCDVIW